MESNSGEVGPQPQFEVQNPQESGGGELPREQALERGAPDENRVGKQQPVAATMPLPPVATPANDQVQADNSASTSLPHISDDTAKDGDIIEKVWIDKAKAIVAQTQNDPFVQKNEMSKVKADYIQKRFNKSIPTGDTVQG